MREAAIKGREDTIEQRDADSLATSGRVAEQVRDLQTFFAALSKIKALL